MVNKEILIGSIQKFSVEDGPGIRTTVFFKGCPLSCKWCHNPEMISEKQQIITSKNNCIQCGSCMAACPRNAISADIEQGIVVDRELCDMCLKCTEECYANAIRPVGKMMTAEEIVEEALKDKEYYDSTGGGITLSGGEVLMHADFAEDIIDLAAKEQINVCLDTCGFGDTEKMMNLVSKDNVTHVLFDIKSVDDDIHVEYTGQSNKLILKNLKLIASDAELKKKLIMRMPLIGNVNDSREIISSTKKLFDEYGLSRVDLLPYHNLGIGKMKRIGGVQEEFEAPSDERMKEIKEVFYGSEE